MVSPLTRSTDQVLRGNPWTRGQRNVPTLKILLVLVHWRVSGHFAPWLDRSKSVHSNTHIDYSLFFHPLPSQTRFAEVANLWCLVGANWLGTIKVPWSERTVIDRNSLVSFCLTSYCKFCTVFNGQETRKRIKIWDLLLCCHVVFIKSVCKLFGNKQESNVGTQLATLVRCFSFELSYFNCLPCAVQIQWLFWWRQYTRDIVPQLSLSADSLCSARPQCQCVCLWSNWRRYGDLSAVNFLTKLSVCNRTYNF